MVNLFVCFFLFCFVVGVFDLARDAGDLFHLPYLLTASGNLFINEPRREKPGFLLMRKQRRRSASRLPSAPLFSLHGYFLNPKFQASSHLL